MNRVTSLLFTLFAALILAAGVSVSSTFAQAARGSQSEDQAYAACVAQANQKSGSAKQTAIDKCNNTYKSAAARAAQRNSGGSNNTGGSGSNTQANPKDCSNLSGVAQRDCLANNAAGGQQAQAGLGGGNAAQSAGSTLEGDPKNTSIVQWVNAAYTYLAVIGGLLAVLMLIYAGYRYMTSYGDPEKISDAKDIVEKTLLGLSLLILAALILNAINPKTAEDACKPTGQVNLCKPGG